MAHSSLSPGFVKIRYTGAVLTHHQTLPVEPVGEPVIGTEPSFLTRDASTVLMSTAVEAYVALLKPLFGSGTTFVDAEFWSQPTPEDDPFWVYTHPIGEVGTNATANASERQSVVSFRTGAGGIAFNYLMEISAGFVGSLRQNFPTTSSGHNALAAYLVGDDGWVVGRDGGFYITPVWFTTKNNDALRKRLLNL